MSLLALETVLVNLQCGTCGVWHAIPENLYNTRKIEGGYWYCPNGHQRGFSEGSLRKQLEKEKKRREWAEAEARIERGNAEHERRRANGYKGEAAKIKKRVKHGVCPCCNRSFENLKRHMQSQHPNYGQ